MKNDTKYPTDWEFDTVGKHMTIETGSKNTEDSSVGGRYPFFVRSQKIEQIDTYHYDCEAVLTAGDGVGTGKVFHYINGKFDAHQRVYIMHDFAGVDGRFFFYYFSKFFYDEVKKYTAKTSVDSVRKAMIADMLVPLPPLSEQKAIASALTDIDNEIATVEKLIGKINNIRLACMQSMYSIGNKQVPLRRLHGYTGRWHAIKIGDALTICHGRSQHKVECESGKYPIMGTSGIIGYANDFLYDKPCVLIGRKGTIDKPMYIDKPFWSIDTLFYSQIHEGYNPKFLYYAFCLIPWSDYNEASGVPSLSTKLIENINIYVPLSIEEQKDIANVLSNIDSAIKLYERKHKKLTYIKQGMMDALLTGKIRLVQEE